MPAAISADEFAALMRPLGPFGPAPPMVAGVSGGPDSLALALLADAWARARGGRLTAIICDHGLRPGSAADAAAAAAMLEARGIAHAVVRLRIPPGAGLQARARTARRAALLDACARAGAPWLLLGHHRGDQAETLLLRGLAGSGAVGLAGMAPVRAAAAALILRPLLGQPKARLEATVMAAGLAPLRDPSNQDPRFDRVRLRGGGAEPVLAEAAGHFAHRAAGRDAAVAARLAEAAALAPEGYAWLDLPALGVDGVALAALRRLVWRIGAGTHPPAEAATAALLARGQGSLGGAVLRRDGLLLREAAAMAPTRPSEPGVVWDGRFRILEGPTGHRIGALGEAARGIRRPAGMPAAVARTLPALWHETALAAVPALDYPDAKTAGRLRVVFAPRR